MQNMEHIKHIKHLSKLENIQEYMNILTKNDLVNILDILDDNYYNDISMLSDSIYDKIYYYTINKYNTQRPIGYMPRNNIVKLPVYMGSENKTYKEDNKLKRWLNLNGTDDIIISAKADGVSILIDLVNKKTYTRGDGNYGSDISYICNYIDCFKNTNGINILRGELVVPKPLDRSYISGKINKKKLDTDDLNNVKILIYEIIEPRYTQEEQFILCKKNNINTVSYIKYKHCDVTYKSLKSLLIKYREELYYYVDGLVLRNNKLNEYPTSGNPKYSISYKYNFSYIDGVIKNLVWNISKNNTLIPVAILYNHVTLDNANISRITCYNAKYVIENNIGRDTVVRIVKSGSVIPTIYKVIKPTEPDLPNYNYRMEKHDFVLLEDNIISLVKKIKYMFKELGFKNITSKSIETFITNNNISHISDIFDISNISDSFNKNDNKLIKSINILLDKKIPKHKLLYLLSIPSISKARAEKIYNHFGDDIYIENITRDYTSITGINKILSDNINIEISKKFYDINKLYNCLGN